MSPKKFQRYLLRQSLKSSNPKKQKHHYLEMKMNVSDNTILRRTRRERSKHTSKDLNKSSKNYESQLLEVREATESLPNHTNCVEI